MEASMPRLVSSVMVTMLTMVSMAGARPNTTTMSCDQAVATVTRAGSIVLSTGPHTYERFVASIQFCMPRQQTEPGLAPTRDSRHCQVGFVCRRPDWFHDDK
jgi:hypothetical protein